MAPTFDLEFAEGLLFAGLGCRRCLLDTGSPVSIGPFESIVIDGRVRDGLHAGTLVGRAGDRPMTRPLVAAAPVRA
jgi:hypothetical protein